MSKHVDYYRTLQVHHDAVQDVIDAAYRCLSKQYHPDLNKTHMATERMKSINVAYGVVGNPKKRREYHTEWLRYNNIKPKPTLEAWGRQNNDSYKIEQAEAALDEFFCATVNEDWEKAYQRLTAADKKNIPLEDFLEWKKAVAQVYRLGNYKITYFRKYSNCDYAGVIYPEVFQFSVGLTEMQLAIGQISEEYTQKYVAFDSLGCNVCLGYTDLKPTINKFKYLAQALPKLDKDDIFIKAINKIDPLTGLLSRSGFIEQAEMELLRSQRYGNKLSLGVITIRPDSSKEEVFEDNQLDACMSYISEILCGNVRKTDIIGRCNESSLAILFTETKLKEANGTMVKLVSLTDVDHYLNYRVYSAVVSLANGGDIEKILQAALERVILKEKTEEVDNNIINPTDNNAGEDRTECMDGRLGKYNLSEILGFNKKGKNHF